MTEADLAARLVAWLEAAGWDVYQEVEVRGGLADLVAIRQRRAWVIECKLGLGFDVIAQAARHLGTTHYVSVAVPRQRRGRGRQMAEDVLDWRGIGLLELGSVSFSEPVAPRLWRRLVHDVRLNVKPEHKTAAAAGTNGGGYWTAWKQNVREIREWVAEHPGATVKALATEIRTSYVTGPDRAANVRTWVDRGIVPGVRLQREGRRLTLWPVDA